MAEDLHVKGYYGKLREDLNLMDTNWMCHLGMEFLLSALLFKGDLSRVVYSKEDIAFRRRVETVGQGDVDDQSFNYHSLNLPFACYSQSGQLEEDDRGFTQNTWQIVKGWIDPISGVVIKAAACKIPYSATIFYARRDDINIANQLLFWEKTPQAPLCYVVESKVMGEPVNIPVFITIEDIDANPEYQEKEWLEKSKIFPLKVNCTVRTYQTLIEDVEGYVKLPLRFSGIYAYNDEEVVFTQKTTLIWSDKKWSHPHHKNHLISFDKNGWVNDEGRDKEDELETKILMIDSEGDAKYRSEGGQIEILKNEGDFVQEKIDNVVADVIEGYFSDDRECRLDKFKITKTTKTTATFEWSIKEDDIKYFKQIDIYIPGIFNKSYTDPGMTSLKFTKLNPGSTYKLNVVVISNFGSKITYNLDIKTAGEAVLGNKLSDNLIGRTFNNL